MYESEPETSSTLVYDKDERHFGKSLSSDLLKVWLMQESGLLKGRSYTARALTEGDTVKHRYVGHFRLENGLEVYQRSFNVFNLTLWDDIMEEFGDLTDQDVLVREKLPAVLLCCGSVGAPMGWTFCILQIAQCPKDLASGIAD